MAKARARIEKLVHLTPQTARIVSGGVERIVAAETVQVGDVLHVLPGESIPVDGVIVSGRKHGFLREGDALEWLVAVSRIAFDKTGTLTNGMPQVVQVTSVTGEEQKLYALAVAAEQRSEHPLGRTGVSY